MSDTAMGTLPAAQANTPFQVDTSGIDLGETGGGGGGRSQREKVMIAILVAVLVVGGIVLLAKKLHGSPSTPSASSPTSATSPGGSATTTPGGGSVQPRSGTAPSSTQATLAPLAPFQVYTSRDPFVPVALPVGTGSLSEFGVTLQVTTTTALPPIVPGASSTTATVPGQTTTTTTTTTAPTPTSPQPVPSTTHVIELISVYTSNGQPTGNVTVDGVAYTVYDGSTFATNFTVIDLDTTTSCGTFLYADYEFELCSGQQATV